MPKGRSSSFRVHPNTPAPAPASFLHSASRDTRSPFSVQYTARSHSTHSLHTQSVRASTLALVIPSYFRRNADGASDDLAATYVQKTPLVTLKLSSLSFLDSVVQDDFSRDPLYTIKTNGTTSTIKRSGPWSSAIERTAVIKWPTMVPAAGKNSVGVLVQMKEDEYWRNADEFLHQSSSKKIMSSPSRKFNIPRYSHTLRWKRVGHAYWCTCPSVKGPIAIFEPKVDSVPARLKVYETLHDKNDGARQEHAHNGVHTLLLDYLLVTALLLVTDIQEWMVVKKFRASAESFSALDDSTAGPSRPASPSRDAPNSISASRWRKILDREPLFPKLNLRKRDPSPSSRSDFTPFTPPTPTSLEQNRMAKIVDRTPLFPTLRTPSPVSSISSFDMDGDAEPSRAPSPSTVSMFSTTASTSAPSHNYLDPSFYAPPVPPIPAKYANSSRGSSHFALNAGGASPSASTRGLPTPPQSAGASPVSDPWRRSRVSISTDPLRPHTAGSQTSSSRCGENTDHTEAPSPATVDPRRSTSNGHARTNSISSTTSLPRPLPAPPMATTPAPLKSAMRAQGRRTSSTPRSLPPTPSRPPASHVLQHAGPSSVTLAEEYTRGERGTRYRDYARGYYTTIVDADDKEEDEKQLPPALDEWKRTLGQGRPIAERGRAARGNLVSVFDMPPPAYTSIYETPLQPVNLPLQDSRNTLPGAT
ncbi:hypothetical protein HGRIS_002758 [Hohenbuehelia grisea]|uniref:Uncharacterized protein n=1 Tax=Hohenbuehelia grisea TaxID=104357 RepID=A0ABR3JMM8_9AGAR